MSPKSAGLSHIMQAHPCRLFVITARDAPTAIVLRRGPSKWYHVLRWHTNNDTFEPGAWFHGRIYEERCDLSPDGALMVYFCHGGACREAYTDSWTAVSKAPWLYALALWPWGTTYGGGGRFFDNRSLTLHAGMHVPTHPDHPAHGLTVIPGSAEYHRSTGNVDQSDWVGRDHAGSLIFSRSGKLFRRDRRGNDREIADFNSLRPAPVRAPDWARKPLVNAQEIERMLKTNRKHGG
jgi:hypothetical protein